MQTHHRDEAQESQPNRKVFIIRQILNAIFMVGAIIGGVLYWIQPEPTFGILVIMTAMFFKMAECVLRFKR